MNCATMSRHQAIVFVYLAFTALCMLFRDTASLAAPRGRAFSHIRDESLLGIRGGYRHSTSLHSQSILMEGGEGKVEALLQAIKSTKSDHRSAAQLSKEEYGKQSTTSVLSVKSLLKDLEDDGLASNEDDNCFAPLLGLYDVVYIQTARAGDNPVGGKWTQKNGWAQKLLKTRHTFQHLIPANSTGLGALTYKNTYNTTIRNENVSTVGDVVAEAVNIVSLESLWGTISVTVLLRGDAVPLSLEERTSDAMVEPLSNRAVRVYFDPPRIIVGKRGRKVNVSIGPRSSVVLDTTYVDDKIRVGKGGTSGTKFVFLRCGDFDATGEKYEWKAMLLRRPLRKSRVFSVLGAMAGIGIYSAFYKDMRVLGAVTSSFALLVGVAVAFSGGGIKNNRLR